MDAFLNLLANLTAIIIPGGLFGIIALIFSYHNIALQESDERQKYTSRLSCPDYGSTYRQRLGQALDRIDGLFVRPNADHEPKPRGFFKGLGWESDLRVATAEEASSLSKAPFGWPVFDLCLKVAIAYPAFAFLAQWALTGSTNFSGIVDASLAGTSPWALLVTQVWLALTAWKLTSYLGLPIRAKRGVDLVWLGLAFAVAVTGTFAATFAVALAVAFAGAFTVAFALAFAVTFEVAGAVAFVVALSVALPVAVIIPGTFAGAIAGAGAGAGASATLVGYATRHTKGALAYALLWCFAIGAAFGLAPFYAFNFLPALLFWLVLPLVNAPFDFVSIGITRHLLRRGLEKRTAFRSGALDVLFALFLFTALGVALIGVIHAFNVWRGAIAYDLGGLFTDLQTPGGWKNHLWVFAVLFTTALPTLLHLSSACFSAVVWLPEKTKTGVLGLVEAGETSKINRARAAGWLTAFSVFSYATPPLLLAGILLAIANGVPWILTGYLSIFEGFAALIGVPGIS